MTQVPSALVADLGRAKRMDQLLAAIDEHDHYTGGHSCRVAAQAGLLARLLGLDDQTVERVKAAGLVHDIGKVHIQRYILRKRTELTDYELSQMKMHPITGATMLSCTPGMEELAPIVLHHHERWDGQGYPMGVSGIDIPIESRVIFVADAFDAMTTARAYGDIVGTRMAIEEIERCAGWQFDPSVAHAIKLAYDKKWLEPNGIEDRIPAVEVQRHPY